MHHDKFRNIMIVFLVMLILGAGAATANAVGEDGENSGADNAPAISRIRDIPPIDGDRNFVEEAEQQYDFIGIVDDVQNDGFVISDTYFKKAKNAKLTNVNRGGWVGVSFNNKGEIVFGEGISKPKR